jgi:hypothetical protein
LQEKSAVIKRLAGIFDTARELGIGENVTRNYFYSTLIPKLLNISPTSNEFLIERNFIETYYMSKVFDETVLIFLTDKPKSSESF